MYPQTTWSLCSTIPVCLHSAVKYQKADLGNLELSRTTDSTGEIDEQLGTSNQHSAFFLSGNIKDRTWYGVDGMEHVRTVKEPRQSIPTFAETVTLLMQAS